MGVSLRVMFNGLKNNPRGVGIKIRLTRFHKALSKSELHLMRQNAFKLAPIDGLIAFGCRTVAAALRGLNRGVNLARACSESVRQRAHQ